MALKKLLVCSIITIMTIESCSYKRYIPLSRQESTKYLEYYLKKDTSDNILNKEVLIADEETAINVAEIYLFKIYGKKFILNERPYKIDLVNGYWVIIGNLPKLTLGGNFEIVINSKNGEVIGLAHGK